MIEPLLARPWHAEFSNSTLSELRAIIPACVQASQLRSAAAHEAYEDPTGSLYVYGAGMSRGVAAELEARASALPGFRYVTAPGTTRKLFLVENVLLFPLRVGVRMPRNHTRVRLSYLPEGREVMLRKAGMTKYVSSPLPGMEVPTDDRANTEDAVRHLQDVPAESLIVPYFSSDPRGIGSLYWAPARLNGKHLEFSEPERLNFVTMPSSRPVPRAAASTSTSRRFADGQRPTTATSLRVDRKPPQ